jgi:tetratricopeptide (TPR) repeat protein
MITLRSYSNQAEAAMAKSLLDDHEIVCSLADENSNLYGGGPLVMPIRLLVAEEQAEQAGHVLDDARPPLQDDFDTGSDSPETAKAKPSEILPELGKLRNASQWMLGMVAALLVLTIYLITELPRRQASPWTSVYQAMRHYDYKKALELSGRIATEHPNAYYAHEYRGDIYLEMGDLAHAEAEYTRAYELSPPQVLLEKLRVVRERRVREKSATPTPAPAR